MPGSDFDFEFRWVPNTYQARIQRAAVLYPLMGMARTAGEISVKARSLVRVWRARAAVLADAGWLPRADRRGLVYARNCTPAFVYAVPKSRPCNSRTICPFCYARWVREIWMKIDGVFPYGRQVTGSEEYHTLRHAMLGRDVQNDLPAVHLPDVTDFYMDGRPLRSIVLDEDDVQEVRFPYHLVEIFRRELAPFEREDLSSSELCRSLLEEIVEHRSRRMRYIHALGSFVLTTVVPSPRGWKIRQRELHQVDPGYVIKKPEHGRLFRHERPTRRIVFHAVAHVCRYPKELLYGDRDWVALFLACHRGRRDPDPAVAIPTIRLSATYGTFRSRR